MDWLGLDVGGANLKVANGKSFAESRAFALWQNRDTLAQELRTLLAEAGLQNHLAVTMTGELADCFESKEEGVNFILDAVEDAAAGRHTRVAFSDGKMVTPQIARRKPHLAASANWYPLAKFAARFCADEPSLLLDIGSTSSDIIPIIDGEPAANGKTDVERLINGELVYTGVERSPICAIAREVPYRNQMCGVAQELFATMLDAYILVGDLNEDLANQYTADGRPATKPHCRTRMGRMICVDNEQFNHRDAVVMAQSICDAQTELVASAISKVIAAMPHPPRRLVLSGHGEFLGARAIKHLGYTLPGVSLTKELGHVVSRCATAHALALTMHEASQL